VLPIISVNASSIPPFSKPIQNAKADTTVISTEI
jgi:hypothetical protein